MLAPVIRIGLRYLAGFLVAKGVIDTNMGANLAADADILSVLEIAAGLAIAAATEVFYILARRLGWAK